MSSYSKLIIFIVFLLIISAAIIFIDSSMDNINKTMPEISNSIVSADAEYNEAVELVNYKSFYDGMDKAKSAGDNYNDSLKKLKDIKDRFSTDINDVQNEYIDTVIKELELKIQAVDKLKLAIECFEVESNDTGTDYTYEANELMYEAVEYQNARDTIVKDNPKVFK